MFPYNINLIFFILIAMEKYMSETIQFKLNNKPVSLNVDGNRTFLWVLRTDLGLTGTKYGCGEGHCGACTVLVDGQATRSCVTRLGAVAGKAINTIEAIR